MSWVITGSEKTPVDPQFTSVSLLLHGNGTNGSTTIVDSSQFPKTVTAFGNAQISTAQGKFGTASIAFDGNGDYVQSADNPAFDISSGNFTIECFVYPLGSTDRGICSKRNVGAPEGFALEVRATGAVWLRNKIDGTYSDVNFQTATGLVSNSAWTHIALVRDGSLFSIYVNGTSRATRTSAGLLDNPPRALVIGKSTSDASNENPFNGYIDEFRLTKGVARYTANFTPPTAAFPDI
jgi:hypothetical protein